jgi:hypothetical protein
MRSLSHPLQAAGVRGVEQLWLPYQPPSFSPPRCGCPGLSRSRSCGQNSVEATPADGDAKQKQTARRQAFHRALRDAQASGVVGVRDIGAAHRGCGWPRRRGIVTKLTRVGVTDVTPLWGVSRHVTLPRYAKRDAALKMSRSVTSRHAAAT